MCPPLSCCHRRCAGLLSTQVYHLARLLLASSCDEVLPHQQPWLEAQAARLRGQIQLLVQHRWRVTVASAMELVDLLLTRLLQEDCCRRSLRRAVPLHEAQGLALVLA